MSETTGTRWRYQPVYVENDDDRCYSLCECHFDEEGKLVAWTECCAMEPSGNSPEDLRGDLAHMLADAYKWEPVAFSDLCVGMTFTRTGADVERIIAAMEAAKELQ